MNAGDLAGRTVVLRIDRAPDAPEAATLAEDVAFLHERGVRPIVVAPDGETARGWVRRLNRLSDRAIALSGADAGLLPAGPARTAGTVRAAILATLAEAGYVPIIEPTALGFGGVDVALEPDDVAVAVSAATGAARAVFFHDAGGVRDPDSTALYADLTPAEALAYAERSEIAPTLRSVVRAAARTVRGGAGTAHILDGRVAHAAIVEFVGETRLGTRITGSLLFGA